MNDNIHMQRSNCLNSYKAQSKTNKKITKVMPILKKKTLRNRIKNKALKNTSPHLDPSLQIQKVRDFGNNLNK